MFVSLLYVDFTWLRYNQSVDESLVITMISSNKSQRELFRFGLG